ncbi:hypothetical protein [Bradyrhizobium sp. CCBAU 21365]|uniref:hypothetical protein n=1 Tax=Bradyrhizobium sp. CCBAU 21365 TaxID=1325083 RepID=UPI001FEF0FCE|nr:hypothetical protein [Bradyrhizobium sp. CCBAU 21365]
MKIIDQSHGEAQCVWFDNRGTVHRRSFDVDSLAPLRLVVSPRSTWPEITQIDVIQIEKEQRDVAASRRSARAAARKSRRSNRIKRGRNA